MDTEERRYTTLFATDDIKTGPRKEPEDDFKKLQAEFGSNFDPGPDRPRVFIHQPIDDDDEFEFLHFDDDDESEHFDDGRSTFLRNIRGYADSGGLIIIGTIVLIILLTGYALVKCIRTLDI